MPERPFDPFDPDEIKDFDREREKARAAFEAERLEAERALHDHDVDPPPPVDPTSPVPRITQNGDETAIKLGAVGIHGDLKVGVDLVTSTDDVVGVVALIIFEEEGSVTMLHTSEVAQLAAILTKAAADMAERELTNWRRDGHYQEGDTDAT